MKHTPGSWKVSHSCGDWRILPPQGFAIAHVYDCESLHETEANARLIAASPKLADACKAARIEIAAEIAGVEDLESALGVCQDHGWNKVLAKLDAALADAGLED